MSEHLWIWIAWHLPRQLAYWVFIRVYACDKEPPSNDFNRIANAWNAGAGR